MRRVYVENDVSESAVRLLGTMVQYLGSKPHYSKQRTRLRFMTRTFRYTVGVHRLHHP